VAIFRKLEKMHNKKMPLKSNIVESGLSKKTLSVCEAKMKSKAGKCGPDKVRKN